MDVSSPTKRRVLASLDVNAPSPNSKAAGLKQHAKTDLSPSGILKPFRDAAHLSVSPEHKKRTLPSESNQQQPAKKPCLDTMAVPTSVPESRVVEANMGDLEMAEPDGSHTTTRQRSVSPDACSVFDNSVVDTSQATAFTEPDLDGVVPIGAIPTIAVHVPLPPPQPRRVPTREESRQKAEILKLRLGLANYKLRTGQADVPLDQLQMRPMPGAKRRSPGLPPSSSAATIRAPAPHASQEWFRPAAQAGEDVEQQNASGQEEEEDGDEAEGAPPVRAHAHAHAHAHPFSPEKNLLPRLAASGLYTPQRSRFAEEDEKLTSSALRGGAVNGLLSLARG